MLDKFEKAMSDYSEAKYLLNQAKSELSNLAYELSDMPVKDALKAQMIRFNFPIHPGVRKAIIDNK